MNLRFIDFTPGLRLVASTHADPTEGEWEGLVASVRRQNSPGYRLLVITDGGSPNLKQRRAINAVLAEKQITARSAVISASPSMRALMSAANWIARNDLRAYPPGQLQEAFAYLQLAQSETEAMRRGIEQLSSELNLQLFRR